MPIHSSFGDCLAEECKHAANRFDLQAMTEVHSPELMPVPLSLAAGQRLMTPAMEPVLGWIGVKDAGVAQFLVEFAHVGKNLLVRKRSRFRRFACFHDYHHSHIVLLCSFCQLLM